MCLDNYLYDAQESLSSMRMDSLVGIETVPTTPVIDSKQNVWPPPTGSGSAFCFLSSA